MRPARGPVNLGSVRSFGRAQGFVGIIRVDWVHSDAFWAWSGSFGVVGLIRALSGCRTVPCSLVCHNIKGSGVPLFRYGTVSIWHCIDGTVKW